VEATSWLLELELNAFADAGMLMPVNVQVVLEQLTPDPVNVNAPVAELMLLTPPP
jgi:hypothetical protein